MAGYRFLMRYYCAGDDIYFFGFSRGAYTARSLAELLDYVGLLSAGNEEMLRFAWKTFASWQMRSDSTDKARAKKRETFRFMKNFRETFSRPIDRIRFIGLFDCVNSVPQFEAAWMTRTKFPYTAKTSAQIIRHAVSIDERRAKFRQDLISEQKDAPDTLLHPFREMFGMNHHLDHSKVKKPGFVDEMDGKYRRKSHAVHHQHLEVSGRASGAGSSTSSLNSATVAQERAMEAHRAEDSNFIDESDTQDILEV